MFKLLTIFASTASAAELFTNSEPISGSYIVVFKKGTQEASRSAHMEFATAKNAQINRKYNIGEEFMGYAANMDQNILAVLLNSDEVDYIEEDGMMYATKEDGLEEGAACKAQEGATWGLVRTSERALKITGEYVYPDTAEGQGTTSYVIDTGVYIEHDEFEGRATWGYNSVDRDDTDGNGHGTHCAGTVAGKTYGMAKKANVVAVKVLSASGSGSTAGVIDGINWAANNHVKGKSTANLSLGGGFSSAMNTASNAAVNAGLVMVVASGNSNADACNSSPASADQVIAVNAADNRDYRASFSNYGRCTDVFAPGVSITSAWINSKTSTNTISGTSMAAPHVCGQANKYLSSVNQATPAMVAAFITSEATSGLIVNPGNGSPNLNMFADCGIFAEAPKTTTKLESRYA